LNGEVIIEASKYSTVKSISKSKDKLREQTGRETDTTLELVAFEGSHTPNTTKKADNQPK
jgi:hypothetical protein